MSRSIRGLVRTALAAAIVAQLSACGAQKDAGALERESTASGLDTQQIVVTEATNFSVTGTATGPLILALQGELWTLPREGGNATRITDAMLDMTEPHVSPDGRSIVAQGYDGDGFGLWVMDIDGANSRRLPTGEGDATQPRWAPDGKTIAFISTASGTPEVWTVALDGTDLRRITSSPAITSNIWASLNSPPAAPRDSKSSPAWTPDGGALTYLIGDRRIGQTDLDTNRERILFEESAQQIGGLAWSPDGATLAYVAAGRLKLWNAAGASTTLGSHDDVFPFAPSWQDPETLIVAANGGLWLQRLGEHDAAKRIPFQVALELSQPRYPRRPMDPTDAREQPVRGLVGPALSPDGRAIAFKALNDLWLLTMDGSVRKLTDDSYYECAPAWSPDSRKIVYASDERGTPDLYILDIESGRKERLTEDAGAETSPAWSSDGKTLAYQNERHETWILDLSTRKSRRLLPTLHSPSRPSFSPDGRSLAMAVGEDHRNRILIVDLGTGATRIHEPAPGRSIATRGDDGPVWTPGGQLLFTMGSTLWSLPVDAAGTPTGPARQLTTDVSDAPSWGRGGAQILYLSNGALRLIDADGSNARPVSLPLTWRQHVSQERLLIRAGGVWDGVNKDVRRDVDIEIDRGRIVAIRSRGEQSDGFTGRVIDATDLTVTAGLVDMHVHKQWAARYWGDRQGRMWLSYGVTSTRSPGDPAYRSLEDREAIASGARLGPRLFMTGEMLDGPRITWPTARPVENEEQLQLELQRARELQYDVIKTYMRLPSKWQAHVVREAHDMGVPVTSHYLFPGVRIGVDGQEHLGGPTRWGFVLNLIHSRGNLYEDVAQAIAHSKIFVSTTNFAASALIADQPQLIDDPRTRVLFPAWEQARLKEELRCTDAQPPCPVFLGPDRATSARNAGSLARLHRAGARLIAGTDSPLDNFALSYHFNLRALQSAGLEPFEVLQIATVNAAEYLGLKQHLGTVEPGKVADLIFVRGDPSKDIAKLTDVAFVMTNGVLHTQEDLLAPFQ